MEARDFIDVDAIRTSGLFSDAELLDAAAKRDPGFEPSIFAAQLDQLTRITTDRFDECGLTPADIDQLRGRYAAWTTTIRVNLQRPQRTGRHAARIAPAAHNRRTPRHTRPRGRTHPDTAASNDLTLGSLPYLLNGRDRDARTEDV